MPRLEDWEPWMQHVVREIVDWLHTRDKSIDLAPRESRGDKRIGLVWHGRETRFNIVCFHRLNKEFRIELLLTHNRASQLARELRDAGLDSWYTDSNRRLNIPLTAPRFEKYRELLRRLVDATYDQA